MAPLLRPWFPPALLSLLLTLSLLSGCGSPDPRQILEEMTAAQHFAEGQALEGEPEELPLALWHFGQCLAKADPGTPLADSAALEREKCLQLFLRSQEQGGGAASRRRELEEENRLLRRRNDELESWLSRLKTENLSLRQSLLKAQERMQTPQ
ncbi:MAG: hypothetical protein ACI4SG_01335 [Oligosphaeraceae bacterium]